jgi:hypothetical protein
MDLHDVVLEVIYPVAQPTEHETLEGWLRRHHQDLAAMSDEALRSEKRRLMSRLDLDHPMLYSDWLAERAACLDAEIRTRSLAVGKR